jgi:hypothetical protein
MIRALETDVPTIAAVPDRAEFLELVHVWLRFAGDKLLQLCLAGTESAKVVEWDLDADEVAVGELADVAGVGTAPAFSRARYVFWKDRAAAMAGSNVDGGDVTEAAARCRNGLRYNWNVHFGLRD